MLSSVFLGMLLMAVLVYYFSEAWITHVFPTETIRRVLHRIMEQSEAISTTHAPRIALIQSRECQASLETLIRLVSGGSSTLDALCGIETEKLQNILHDQERQILAVLSSQK